MCVLSEPNWYEGILVVPLLVYLCLGTVAWLLSMFVVLKVGGENTAEIHVARISR